MLESERSARKNKDISGQSKVFKREYVEENQDSLQSVCWTIHFLKTKKILLNTLALFFLIKTRKSVLNKNKLLI